MATAASRGTTVVSTSGTTWASATAAQLCDGTVGTYPGTDATFTNAASGGVGTVVIGGYSFGTLAGTITACAILVRHYESSPTTRWTSLTAQLETSTGTTIGTAQTVTLGTTAASITVNPSVLPTLAQVNAGLRVLITATHSGTSSGVVNLDNVDITVTYTPPGSFFAFF